MVRDCESKFNRESPYFDALGVCGRCFHVAECRRRERFGLKLNSDVDIGGGRKVMCVSEVVKSGKRFPTHVGNVTEKNAATGKYEVVPDARAAVWLSEDGNWLTGQITIGSGVGATKVNFNARKA